MIDTKRLAADAAYWDEVAPETATHYSPTHKAFYKEERGVWLFDSSAKGELARCVSNKINEPDMIPRPAKQPQDWKDGLPPLGRECELWLSPQAGYVRFTPEYYGNRYVIGRITGGREIARKLARAEFRPARTKEQRDREELIEVIRNADEMAFSFRPDDIADAVLAWIKEHNQ